MLRFNSLELRILDALVVVDDLVDHLHIWVSWLVVVLDEGFDLHWALPVYGFHVKAQVEVKEGRSSCDRGGAVDVYLVLAGGHQLVQSR